MKKYLFFTILVLGSLLTLCTVDAECNTSGSILAPQSECSPSQKEFCEAAYQGTFGSSPDCLYLTCEFESLLGEGGVGSLCNSSSYNFDSDMCYYDCSYIKINNTTFCLFSNGESCSSEAYCSASGCSSGDSEDDGDDGADGADGTTGTTNNPGASNNDEELNLIYPERLQLSLGMPLNQLINALYNFIVWISGLAAFAMLVWGGFDWLTSSGNPTKTSAAREKLTAALTGLLLVLGSYLILRTINPDLTILINPDL